MINDVTKQDIEQWTGRYILCGLLVLSLDKCIMTAFYLVQGIEEKLTIHSVFLDIRSRY